MKLLGKIVSTSIPKMWSDLKMYKVGLWHVCELHPGLSISWSTCPYYELEK